MPLKLDIAEISAIYYTVNLEIFAVDKFLANLRVQCIRKNIFLKNKLPIRKCKQSSVHSQNIET